MQRVLIFGGTTEGRIEAAKAINAGDQVMVCVTSEYARQFLPQGADCHVGGMERGDMLALMAQLQPERVIDATHPFAIRATETIKACTSALQLPYQRILRPKERQDDWHDAVVWVDRTEEAAEQLLRTQGHILLTTGSNTLSEYTRLVDKDRLYVRVLPTLKALRKCMDAGIMSSHIVAMQGPFTRNMNAAVYEQLNISVMVSKDSGDPGGVTDKVLPALAHGITVIMIRRPKEDETCAVKA